MERGGSFEAKKHARRHVQEPRLGADRRRQAHPADVPAGQHRPRFDHQGRRTRGACLADSAAGALNAATHGRWSGSFSKSYKDYFITAILGDTESGSKTYWEILVNNVPASTGACEVRLHRGDRLLFAAVPVTGPAVYPIGILAPSIATAGRSFAVKIVSYTASGKAKTLPGVTVRINGKPTERGFIRDETAVKVLGHR
ncbi:MAG: DUF4430 domain-containing protein [Solirubrobacteraceae bacterium]